MLIEKDRIAVAISDPAFYKQLLDQMSEGIYFVDRERRILYWNEGAYRLTGYKSDELIGRCCNDNLLCHVDAVGRQLCQDGCPLTACIRDGESHEGQVYLRHKEGRRVPVHVRVQPIRNAEGAIVGAIEIFIDNSVQLVARHKTEEMERLAFLDQLTGLPNRRYLEMAGLSELREYQLHQDPFGVLMADIDRFKAINDTFGHAVGDSALRETAKTLTGALRGTDVVGRWGGDEFLAIVRHVDRARLRMLAERCCMLVSHTTVLAGQDIVVKISTSIGGALLQPNDSFEGLLRRADSLMYQSKARGRGRAEV